MLLTVESLSIAFGGLDAVQNVSLSVEERERVAIIGPNGAGKSTLFNLISGALRPNSGRVLFDGQDISRLDAHQRVKRGLARSFQRSSIFPKLTAYENVLAAVMVQRGRGFDLFGVARTDPAADDALASVGLSDQAGRVAGTLALGDQKRLELALVLAVKPRLMLLDEPTAGMSPEETAATVALVERLAAERGIALLFTEHDMGVVFGVAQRVLVLSQGALVAEGSPDSIRANPDVQRLYLGEPGSLRF
ncbi:MAG: ABC transporter ATP-binding protein [Anaerolineae bacterium]|jgi:branched-chain amino acid transport system ATP-binding protein|nr:ABC transporter ATP-binding protein [Anaerolineae bacterium]